MPGQARAQHDLSRVIHPYGVKHSLCNVNPGYATLFLHETRLLWLNDFTGPEIILAH
jgi:hypothetical protein